jgi:hypothetical protein
VYEQMVDKLGNVVAEECDAHDGLHLVKGALWAGEAQTRECACGIEGPMIADTMPMGGVCEVAGFAK